jgi:NADH-quinone oxidoreductase subunit A
MEQYLPIVLLLAVAFAFAAGSFLASKLLGPLRPTGAKDLPYESGIVPRFAPTSRFPVRFYLVAMIFIIFDIEVVFLYPWAVMYHQLAKFGLAEMAVFVVVVFISFAYLVSNGALDWGPRQAKIERAPNDLTRTLTTTVRRVPRPSELFDGVAPRELGPDPELPVTAPSAPEPVPAGVTSGRDPGDDAPAAPPGGGS